VRSPVRTASSVCFSRDPAMNLPDKIELRLVAGLLPYARNSRTHSAEQVAQVAASITEFGWTSPILVDCDGGVIAGHARLLSTLRRHPYE
jgi:hypothetical protein